MDWMHWVLMALKGFHDLFLLLRSPHAQPASPFSSSSAEEEKEAAAVEASQSRNALGIIGAPMEPCECRPLRTLPPAVLAV